MSEVPHVIAGEVPTEQQDRIFEAYSSAYKLPAGTVRTAAVMNQAIDWWNERTLCPGCDGEGASCPRCFREWAEAWTEAP
jgi:hypothetical protein